MNKSLFELGLNIKNLVLAHELSKKLSKNVGGEKERLSKTKKRKNH